MKIKSLILTTFGCSVMLWPSIEMQSAPIDLEGAKRIAASHISENSTQMTRAPRASEMTLLKMAGSAERPLYYVMHEGTQEEGFVIVSGEDRLPEVLGFSDTGSFDPGAIPANVQWWLDGYAAQIEAFYDNENLQKAQNTPQMARAAMKQIQPLVTTRWNQSAPYNNQCPTSGTEKCVTGCVATAMAQVMNYHEWPLNPKGSANGVTFDGTTYMWDQMLDDYVPGQYNSAQAAAVATLMRQCGAAVNMSYSPSASGAYSADVQYALVEYFDYNKGMELKYRDGYSFSEWNQIVYEELANNRPLYYSGQAPEGGHAFVCDGYRSNNYFHFNWGWGGAYDGYFILSALNPSGGGIGSYKGGYNTNQMIITGVEPQKDATERQITMVATGGFSYVSGVFRIVDGPMYGTYQENEIYNPHTYDITVTPGLKIQSLSNPDNVKYVAGRSQRTFQQWEGFETISASIPGDLADGLYHVTPAILPEGRDWVDIRPVDSKQTYINLQMSNGQATLTNPSAGEKYSKLYVVGMEMAEGIQGRGPVVARFDIANVGNNDYFGNVTVTLSLDKRPDYNTPSTLITSIPKQSVSSVTFSQVVGYTGACTFTVTDNDNNTLATYQVELADAPRGDRVNNTPLSVGAIDPNFALADTPFEVGFQLYNTEYAGYTTTFNMQLCDYDGNVKMELPSNELTFDGMTTTALAYNAREWTVDPGFYYWMLRDSGGNYIAGPWPLCLTSGALAGDGVDYYCYDTVDKRAYAGVPTDGFKKDVKVAATINGNTVDRIAGGTFTFAYELENLTLPSSIKELGDAALYCADQLKGLEIESATPPAISAEVLPEARFGQIGLTVPAAATNVYKRTDIWQKFFMPGWEITFSDGITLKSGLETDAATGSYYVPYYVNPQQKLQFTVNNPKGEPFCGIYTVDGGEEKGVWCGSDTVTLPVINGKLAKVRFTYDIPAGVEGVQQAEPTHYDVYTLMGLTVLRGGSQDELKSLPAGIYIVNGKKVVIR